VNRVELLEALREPCAQCGDALWLHLATRVLEVEWCRSCPCGAFVSDGDDAEMERPSLDMPAFG